MPAMKLTSDEIAGLTKELQATSSCNPGTLSPSARIKLLLKRSELYMSIREFESAAQDIRLAAQLSGSEPGIPEASQDEIRDAVSKLSTLSFQDRQQRSDESRNEEERFDLVAALSAVGESQALDNLLKNIKALSEDECRLVIDKYFGMHAEVCSRDGNSNTSAIDTLGACVERLIRRFPSLADPVLLKLAAQGTPTETMISAMTSLLKIGGTAVYTVISHAGALGRRADAGLDQRRVQSALEYYINTLFPYAARTDASPDQVRILVRGVLQVLRTEANGSLKSLTQPAITQSSLARSKRLVGDGLRALLTLASTPPWSEEALATAKHSGSVVLLSELLGDVATTGGDSEREPLVLKLSQQIKVQVEDWIQSTKQAECALGLYCLATIFSIDRRGRIALPLLANTDLLKDAFELAEYNAIPTQIALLTLCNEAFADSSCRSLIASHGRAYIAAVANQNKDAPEGSDRRRLFGLASSVLAKVYGAPPSAGGRGMTGEGEMPGGESGIKELSGVEEEDQTSLLRAQVDAISLSLRRSSAITASLATHVESLNYLSLRGRLKDRIASNQQLLADLYAAVRRISGQGNFEPSAVPVITAFRFSVVALSQNLTQYLPELNEEQKALQKLQKRATNPGSSVAGAGGKDSSGRRGEEQDEESHKPERVQARSALVVKAGCVSCLSEIVRGQRKEEEGEGVEALSDGIKDLVAQTLCNLATTPGLRGLIAQQGGIGALMRLFSRAAQEDRRVPPKPFMRAEGGKQVRDFVVAQALAKIAISLPPHLAFPGQTAFGLVRPFLALCVGEENGLAQFEALMALTNLASMPPGAMEEGRDIRTVIAFDQKGLGVIEYLALSEHFMIRRAATELLCNLIADYEVYEHYASHAKPTASGEVQSGDGGKDGDKAYRTSRIHMFVALLDSEDTPTRMATGGALATLTMDSRVCEFLVLGHPTAMDIILRVAGGKDAESKQVKEGLCHRGIAMLANMVGQKRDNKAIFDKIRADRRVERLLREAARGEVVESEVVIGLARKALNDLAEVPADDA